jgi:site-specific DNA-methyltransferase (adenine-specific)
MTDNSTKLELTTDAPLAGMQCYSQPFVSLYNEDCLETIKRIPDKSIDLLLQDPPYGTTQNEWDKVPNLALMWQEWERILKDDGLAIFTAQQPFASELVMSRKGLFKCDWIWMKEKGTGHLNAGLYPLRNHEHIIVFGWSVKKYNPQLEKGKPYQRLNGSKNELNKGNYGKTQESYNTISDGGRYPQTIQFFASDSQRFGSLHPTQKPLDLMRYLILTYSNKGDTVFDGYSGSGTTAEACVIEQRNFIGSELNKEYFNKSVQRLKNVPQSLF